MQELIFATNNANKVNEIRSILGESFAIITLREAGIERDIPEPHETLHENAQEKSKTIHGLTGKNCFSEDTGLEVDALNGAPGVRSARYAGEEADAVANLKKLIVEMDGRTNRKARFRTVISLILNGTESFFEGVCEGSIALSAMGTEGFGYDPVFVPDGASVTFAEMDMATKNKYSHRKKAVAAMVDFLNRENR